MRRVLKLLPIRFFASAMAYMLAGVALGALDALDLGSFRPSHSHLIAGAFFTLVIMGAMYQLVPTILGVELKHRRLAELQFVLVNLAFISIAYSFLFNYGFLKFAGLLAFFSFLLFAWEVFSTALSVGNFYRRSPALWYFIAAMIYLLAGSAYALLGVFEGSFSTARHSHLMTLGFVAMVNFGGLYELFPMLSLRKLHSRELGKLHFLLANAGAIGMFLSFPERGPIFTASSAIFLLGFYLFAYNLARTYFGEARGPEVEMDISARFMVYALIFGVAGVSAGFLQVTGGFPPAFTHVHLVLGWIALTMVGALYHIVPMLTWMEKYSARAAMEKVPLISELYNRRLARALFVALNVLLAAFAFSPMLEVLWLLAIPLAIAFFAFAAEIFLVMRR